MSIGAFLSGFAEGGMEQRKVQQRKEDLALRKEELDVRRQEAASGGSYMPRDGGTGRSMDGAVSGSTSSPSRMTVADPAATDLPAHARAFLNSVAMGESGGAYNVRYTPNGAATFDIEGGHPRIFEDGPHGKSSAAGRYQFTASTWDDVYGGDDFSPAAQDRAAWKLGQDRYKAVTGRSLDEDLQSEGLTERMLSALGPTWAAFNGSPGRFIGEYDSSLKRYTAAPVVEQEQPGRSLRPQARPSTATRAGWVDRWLGDKEATL